MRSKGVSYMRHEHFLSELVGRRDAVGNKRLLVQPSKELFGLEHLRIEEEI